MIHHLAGKVHNIHITIDKFALCYHSFAGDSQLLASVLLTDVHSARHRLEYCVSDIQEWCARRRLQLNLEKPELMWLGGR